ncbi:MAG: adenylate/guanylate cyclase domain-containing protein [Casimicrobiaceae bacterium]
MTDAAPKRRLVAILAADVAGYTQLMEQDTDGTVAAWQSARDGIVAPAVARHLGRVVKLTGDGFLSEFATVQDAVQCAMDLQAALADGPLAFRIGVNLGDIVDDGQDIYGEGINIAARLEALAEVGGICISGQVYESIANRIEAAYEDWGERTVKHVSKPVRVYAIRPRTAGKVRGEPAPAAKPSIAVLPFANMSEDALQEYFSDGITEDIITELSKISGLLVIARNSSFIYKGKSVSIKRIGHELGVRYVLEGSVRKAGDRLRITAQLIDATTDHHLWVERYDRKLEDVFAIQDEVARSVAAAMKVALLPEEHTRVGQSRPRDLEAYDLYLRTRSAPWPPTRDNILRARAAYERIVEADPEFAGGHAGKALTHGLLGFFGFADNETRERDVTFETAGRALKIDPACSQAYTATALANASVGACDAAIADGRRAIELQPSDADAHAIHALILGSFDRCAEGLREIRTALRLDPEYVAGPYLVMLGVISMYAGDFDAAIEPLTRSIARGGPFGGPMLTNLTAAYAGAGQIEQARKAAQTLLEFEPNFLISANRQYIRMTNPVARQRMVDALKQAGLPE